MSTYRIAAGHNVALASLTVLSPQPRTVGLQVTERSYGLSGAAYEQSLYVEFLYGFVNNPTDYASLLSSAGLTSVLYANVTIYARTATYAWSRYNGVAVRPQIGSDGAWNNFYLRDFVLLVKNLSPLSEP